MSAWTKEWVSVLAMLTLIGFFYALMPANPEAGASIFPIMLMILMGCLAGIKIFTLLAFPDKVKGEKAQAGKEPFWGRLLFVVFSLVAYALAVDYIGFFVSSFVFSFGVSLAIQQEPHTLRSVGMRLLVVTGFLLFIHILFIQVLKAYLPRSILF